MKIVSWNVAGIKARLEDLQRLVADYQPKVLCLQKTRTADASVINGYLHSAFCNDRWSGVSTYWHEDLRPMVLEVDTHHMILDFEYFVLINAYIPYANVKVPWYIERRRQWDAWLLDFVKSLPKPVIICGDLNIVHTDLDSFYPSCVRNTGCYYQWERENFNRLLSECKLVDTFRKLHPAERAYTYFDTMHGVDYRATNQGARLDYFLVSESLMPCLMKSEILSTLSAPSSPILLDLQLNKICEKR